MARAAFQVLVIPYSIMDDGTPQYALLRRSDAGYWQGIAGGGEEGETPGGAARREASEEAGIGPSAVLHHLEAKTMLPVSDVCGFLWGHKVLLIPEHSFAVRADTMVLRLSKEHTEYQWFGYDDAMRALKWDSNRTAMWELNFKLLNGLILQ